MSSAARVAKLEDLLERIKKNRRPTPGPIALRAAPVAEPVAEAPAPSAPPPAVEIPEPTTEERLRAPKPTPMEEALETELESHADVDVEVTFDDEGPEITIDEEGEVTEAAPTAPVDLRAPEPEPTPAPEPLLPRPIEVAAAKPSAPVARVVSRPARKEATTFGELLDRTLALRPR